MLCNKNEYFKNYVVEKMMVGVEFDLSEIKIIVVIREVIKS